MHAAAGDVDVDAVDRAHAAEVLVHADQPQHRRRVGRREVEAERLDGAVRARLHRPQPPPAAGQQAPDAFGHEHHDEDHRQPVAGHVDLLQEAQPFGQQDQQHRAERAAERRLRAAEQRHGEELDRDLEREVVGADVGEARRVQRAADRAERGAQREGGDLDHQRGHARDLGGHLVLAHRLHRAAEPGLRQPPDGGDHRIQHECAEQQVGAVVGERVAEDRRPGDARDAVRAARDLDPVGEDQVEDDLEADRHHRQVVPADAQRGQAEREAGQRGERDRQQQREPEIEPQHQRAERHRVGADAEERRLPEMDLPGVAEHHRHAEHGDRIGRRLHEDVQDVGVDLEEVGQQRQRDGDQQQQRQQQREPAAARARGRRHVCRRRRRDDR